MLRIAIVCSFLAFAIACHDHDHEGFATFQACFDDHHGAESLPVNQAIVVCCLDHPINGVSPACGATANDCVAYLTANLSSSSATSAEVTTACNDYITMKGQ